MKALDAYNKSDGLRVGALKRVEDAAKRRPEERFEDLAASLGISDQWIERDRTQRPLARVNRADSRERVLSTCCGPLESVDGCPKSGH